VVFACVYAKKMGNLPEKDQSTENTDYHGGRLTRQVLRIKQDKRNGGNVYDNSACEQNISLDEKVGKTHGIRR